MLDTGFVAALREDIESTLEEARRSHASRGLTRSAGQLATAAWDVLQVRNLAEPLWGLLWVLVVVLAAALAHSAGSRFGSCAKCVRALDNLLFLKLASTIESPRHVRIPRHGLSPSVVRIGYGLGASSHPTARAASPVLSETRALRRGADVANSCARPLKVLRKTHCGRLFGNPFGCSQKQTAGGIPSAVRGETDSYLPGTVRTGLLIVDTYRTCRRKFTSLAPRRYVDRRRVFAGEED
jgi:hypothetical protein